MARGNGLSMVAVGIACALASCTSPPATTQGMVAADPPAGKPNWVVKNAVVVGDVAGSRPTDASSPPAVGADAFRQALEQSLKSSGYLATGRKPRYHLDAALQELDQPKFALTDDTTVTATVLYRLIGLGTNAEYSVTASGTATFDESAIFGTRLRLADERALQANIETLLKKLHRF
ncbi:MAG: hypothetical protein ACREEL_13990 [Stellaceae bacterium]